MKKTILSLLSVACLSTTIAQDSVSVLFIGNSYTYANNLPQMVQDLANSLGDEVYHDSHTAGGATLSNHAGNSNTYVAINSEQWDYVVLQAQSQEPSFPDAQVDSQTLPYAIQLADSVYANRFCSDVMFFMTWGRENGDPQWQPISTFDGMNARLRSAYMRFADSTQGSVSAVGSAWKYVRDNHPSIGLYTTDGSHPSVEGSYLAACTFYASLFRKTPVGATYISSLDAVTAGILQDAAALTVLDSLDQWNLRPLSEHTQADFDFLVNGSSVDFNNMSTKATNYIWSFGDGGTSTDENPSYVYSINGIYDVQLIAESPCDSDTITFQVNVGGVSLNELSAQNIIVRSFADSFEIESNTVINSISIYDLSSRLVLEEKVNSKVYSFELSEYNTGSYVVIVNDENGSHTIRLFNK